MSELVLAKVLGYCMGVKRAVEIAEKTLKDYPQHQVYTLGPLIHNKTALQSLEEDGLKVLHAADVDSLDTSVPTAVIIRAHGIGQALRSQLQKMGVVLIDATCPRVLVNQRRAARFSGEGFAVVIVGDRTHGEVAALAGSVCDNQYSYIIENVAEAKNLLNNPIFLENPAILISQTTISEDEYCSVRDVLLEKKHDLKIFDTICPATQDRQDALANLNNDVEAIIVMGGKNSANTQRLYQRALELSKYAIHVENADEIPTKFYGFKKVGLTAGASTPAQVIDQAISLFATAHKV